jgi:uncharacterized membrane protein
MGNTLRWIGMGAGAAIAAYLTVLHYTTAVSLVCPGGGTGLVNCTDVLTSPESVVAGVPVPLWGLLWFVVGGALLWLRWRWPPRVFAAARWVWSLLGVAAVLWLVYVELGVLHALCVWCTVLHVLIVAFFVDTVLSGEGRSVPAQESSAS